MKKPKCKQVKDPNRELTSGQIRRNERARAHRVKRENGYFGIKICLSCGRQETWCSACLTYSQDCCIPYGTCMCS